MNEQNDNSNKRVTAEKESQNKRARNSPNLNDLPVPHLQHQLFEKIKLKYPPSSSDIKVSIDWFKHWEAYCLQLSMLRPCPVYLSPDEDPKTYVLVPPMAVWYFRKWYGATDEIRQLKLSTSSHSTPNNNVKKRPSKPIVYTAILSDDDDDNEADGQLKFKIYIVGKPVDKFNYTIALSADSTVSSFHSSLLNALKNDSSGTNMNLWLLNQENTSFINNLDKSSGFSLSTSLLTNSDRFAQKIDTSEISFESTIASCLSHMSTSSKNNKENTYLLAVEFLRKKSILPSASSTPLERRTLGLSGLQNLGNTCYMNAALQCLSNTPQLSRYFLSGDYRQDINTSNALGLNGDLAKAYAKLLQDIWSPNTNYGTRLSSLSPKDFKSTFERFNPHFIGYLQQDSQELLSFLLDGLHEDLNRVLNKPYIEIPDYDDHLKDDEIANRFWSYHKSRNDSIIVDLFQGQYKSRLVCETCKKVSITFDPFMYISLPLPVDKCEINIVYLPYLPSQRQLKMKVQLERDATIGQLKQEIEKNITSGSLNIQHDYSLLIAEIYFQKIHRIFKEDDPIRSIKSSDTIYAYQLPCPSTEENDEKWVVFPVYCSTTLDTEDGGPKPSQFGLPIVLAVETEKLNDVSNLYCLIASHIERYCILKLFEEDISGPLPLSVSNGTDNNDEIDMQIQQPIHTTAAVTPAGGRPMVPMSNLFSMHLFEYKTSQGPFSFPVSESHIHWLDADETLSQGRGILIEWSLSKAQQCFGTNSSNNEINTDAWFDYDLEEKKTSYTRSQNKSSRLITLDDCLDEFTGDEQLGNQDSWYCPRCKQHQRALKKMDIWKLPEIMVIHLKRFSQVRRWGNKVDTMIDFPLKELDMTSRVLGHQNEVLIYDLYAVDNHYGGMGGGHYTAYAQNIEDAKWYEFNDSHVTGISSQDVKTNAAYLLFYKRRVAQQQGNH